MRIFEVVDCYPPPIAGGRELQTQALSRCLKARGHDVDVVTLAGPRGPRTEWDGDIPVHRITGWGRVLPFVDPNRPFHPTLPDPGLLGELKKLIRQKQPQIVHVRSWFLYSLLTMLPSRDTRLVVSMHDLGFICPKVSFRYRGEQCSGPQYLKCIRCSCENYGVTKGVGLTSGMTLMKPWRKRVDRYVANSRFVARVSAPFLGYAEDEIDIIPPFLPDEAFRAASAQRPDWVPAGDYLMFAGALAPHKGIDVLLQAWEGLAERPPLVVAGIRSFDSPAVFPPGVVLAENLPRDEVIRAWGHSMAAVVPSVWPEPFPGVALEAMAAGRTVVASAVGGIPDLVEDGVNGLLVAPSDVLQLRSALQRVVVDAALRERLGSAARETATQFATDIVVDRWEQLFGELVGQSGPG